MSSAPTLSSGEKHVACKLLWTLLLGRRGGCTSSRAGTKVSAKESARHTRQAESQDICDGMGISGWRQSHPLFSCSDPVDDVGDTGETGASEVSASEGCAQTSSSGPLLETPVVLALADGSSSLFCEAERVLACKGACSSILPGKHESRTSGAGLSRKPPFGARACIGVWTCTT